MDQLPLMARLRAEADNIADAMVTAILKEIGAYSELDDAELALLHEDVRRIVDESLRLIAEQRPFSEEDLALFVAQGERRAINRFPISEFLRAHSVAAVAAQRKFWEIATDHDWAEVLPASGWIGVQVPRAVKAGTFGYASAHSQQPGMGTARQMIAQHLLAGRPVHDLAEAAGLAVAAGYSVLLCPLLGEDCAPTYQRELWETLAAAPEALMMLTLNEVIVLLPVSDNGVEASRATAGDIVDILASKTGQPISAAFAFRPGLPGVPVAAGEARALCRLTKAMPDTRTRVYGETDLLMERSIATNPALIAELVALLSPLRDGVGLPETLVSLIACDLDRERTATALHIHRRTLSYRLARIGELTGVDPHTVHGIALLRAAVVATRLAQATAANATGAAGG